MGGIKERATCTSLAGDATRSMWSAVTSRAFLLDHILPAKTRCCPMTKQTLHSFSALLSSVTQPQKQGKNKTGANLLPGEGRGMACRWPPSCWDLTQQRGEGKRGEDRRGMRQRSRDSERKKTEKGRKDREAKTALSGLPWAPIPFWRVPYL